MLLRNYKKRAQDVSIYESIGCDKEGNELPIIDLLHTDESTVYENLDKEFLKKTMKRLVDKYLDERERLVVNMRFGLIDDVQMTQQNVADKLIISRSYVSRIEKRALNKIKKAINDEELQL